MPVPVLSPGHASLLTFPPAGRLPSTISAADLRSALFEASQVSGRRRRARLLSRWPPSAAQLGRGLARRLWPRCLSTKPRLQPPPRRTQRADLPSRPGEFHPEPLTDPDMNLSIHPARAIHRRLPPSVEIGGLLRSPVGPSLQRGWPPPFA